MEDELKSWLTPIFANINLIWKDATNTKKVKLALAVYEAQRSWRSGSDDPNWEKLVAAHSIQNSNAIKQLAQNKALQRKAVVTISSALTVSASTTTIRNEQADPSLVYCLWPLSVNNLQTTQADQINVVSGFALFLLKKNEQKVVREEHLPHLYKIGKRSTYMKILGAVNCYLMR